MTDHGGWGPPDAPRDPHVVYYPAETDSKAILALVLAILSYVVFPVLPALFALSFARESRERIAASRGALQGEGMVTAAVVLARVNIGMALVTLLVFVPFSVL